MAGEVIDTFTEVSTTALTAHTPDTGDGWTEEENTMTSGVLNVSVSGGNERLIPSANENSTRVIASVQPNPTVAEYDIEIDWVATGGASQHFAFLLARFADISNYYVAGWYRAGLNPDKRLAKVVAGTPTTLATANNGSGPDQTYKFEVRDAAKKLFEGGSEILSNADDAITAAGKWGTGCGDAIISTDDTRNSTSLDNLTCDEVAAAGRIMSSIAGRGGLAGQGGIAGQGGGLAG